MRFNNKDLNVIIQKVHRSILPPIQNNRINIPGKDGTTQVRTTKGDILLSVDIALLGTSRADYLEDCETLAKYLYFDEEKELILPDEPYRTYMAKLDGDTSMEEFYQDGTGTLNFICKPYKLGATKQSLTGTGTNAGLPCPCKITITFTDDRVTPIIISLGGIEKITVDGSFDSGDILVVDNNYITVNGNNAMSRTLITSDFFELPNGAFAITVNSAAVNIKIDWREQW